MNSSHLGPSRIGDYEGHHKDHEPAAEDDPRECSPPQGFLQFQLAKAGNQKGRFVLAFEDQISILIVLGLRILSARADDVVLVFGHQAVLGDTEAATSGQRVLPLHGFRVFGLELSDRFLGSDE